MAKKRFKFMLNLFNVLATPIKRRKKLTAVQELLLLEQFRSEHTINIIIVILLTITTTASFIIWLTTRQASFISSVLPYIIALATTLVIYFKIQVLNQDHTLMNQIFYSNFRLIIILYDIGIITFILFMSAKSNELKNILLTHFGEPGLTLIFIIISALFFIINIFRFSILSCIATQVFLIISYIIVSAIFYRYDKALAFFHLENLLSVSNLLFILTTGTMTILSALISVKMKNIVIRSKKQESFERFLPEIVARSLMHKDSVEPELTGSTETVTILFSDIRNFTSMSEKTNPKDIIVFLNEYLDIMINIIFKHNGVLNKIMGDGIMAIFGTPFVTNNPGINTHHSQDAVNCAREMIEKLHLFNKKNRENNKPEISIGVGIHTGPAVLGNVGTKKRMEFTAIGDTVNTAARLEGLTKQAGSPILISGNTRESINDDLETSRIGAVSLKGKEQKIEVYSISTGF